MRVPLREVRLTHGEVVSLYDTSGPYCDPAVEIDVNRGFPGVRTAWIEARGDTEGYGTGAEHPGPTRGLNFSHTLRGCKRNQSFARYPLIEAH